MADLQDINVKAFLKFIRYAEHKRDDDLVYYQIYGNQFTFKEWMSMPGAGLSNMPMTEARQLFDQYVAQYAKQ